MRRRPPRSTCTDTSFPYTTLSRSAGAAEAPARKLISLLDQAEIVRAALAARNLAKFALAVERVAIGRQALDASRPVHVDDVELPPPALTFAVEGTARRRQRVGHLMPRGKILAHDLQSEEHTSELQSIMRNSDAAFC